MESTMQTMSVQITDEYLQHFMNYVHAHSEHISISEDSNLLSDPHFYTRQKQLAQDIDDLDTGKAEGLTSEQFDTEMKHFFNTLKSNENH